MEFSNPGLGVYTPYAHENRNQSLNTIFQEMTLHFLLILAKLYDGFLDSNKPF